LIFKGIVDSEDVKILKEGRNADVDSLGLGGLAGKELRLRDEQADCRFLLVRWVVVAGGLALALGSHGGTSRVLEVPANRG
jgi:hypothetical protein